MLSIIDSPQPDPLLEAAPRWQYWSAPAILLFAVFFLYKEQHRTNAGMTAVCCVEFAVVVFAFVRLLREKTLRTAYEFAASWEVTFALTQVIRSIFFVG